MRYRLPDALGGGEYEEYRNSSGTTEAPVGTIAFLENGCIFTVARGLLTEVEPPLPPEPPLGSVVQCDAGYVHIRQGASWTHHDGTTHCGWGDISSYCGGFVRLVPDPFAEPVELPWESTATTGTKSKVDVIDGLHPDDREAISDTTVTRGGSIGCTYYTPETARAKARALWAAADAAERAS